jgi:CRISPR-associated Csx10 family RAMP protein
MNERYLRLELQLLSLTCIGQRPTAPGAVAQTLNYLSGTAVRGGLAAHWLGGRRYDDLRNDEARQFSELFLQGRVRFGNALPLDSKALTEVVPRTAWTAKRHGGWRGDGKSGVRDVLSLLLQPDEQTAQELEELESLGQEFALHQSGRWWGHNPARRLISRTALAAPQGDNDRGLASEGQLYSFEALETRQRFATILSGAAELLEALDKLLTTSKDTSEAGVLRMGQGRSRGMGQVLITDRRRVMPKERSAEQLAEQAEQFSARAHAPKGIVFLPVTLESDMLLRDRYLLPCSSGEPRETLARYLPNLPAPATMRLHTATQSTRWIGGWDEIRRMPRASQLAIVMGSVWVFEVERSELHAAVSWWLEAEHRALGERRGEGYGRVQLLHPLHTEERDLW